MRTVFVGMAAAVMLAACSQELDVSAAGEVSPGTTLSPLTVEDISGANLSGELGCSFSSVDDDMLLVAMGIVASEQPAEGVIKVGDAMVRVDAPDGFNGMVHGATFEGEDHSAQVEITGEPEGGGESPPRPAELTLEHGGGESLTIQGRWECGP